MVSKKDTTRNTTSEDHHDTPAGHDECLQDHEEYHELVVDGTLDLHIFQPGDIRYLVPDYLEECREKGILSVRIIHGKGTGTLRRTVHAILERLPWVASYRLAPEWEGSWGVTIVDLRPNGGMTPR